MAPFKSRKSDRFDFPVVKIQIKKPWIHFSEFIGLVRLFFWFLFCLSSLLPRYCRRIKMIIIDDLIIMII